MTGIQKQISPREGFGHVAVINDAILEIDENGSIGAYNPGARMPDGTIFAGISPESHAPMYTTPADAPMTVKWNAGMKFAEKSVAQGHKDWRVPTMAELNVLYQNRDKGALKGTFNLNGADSGGCYWSSTEAYEDGDHTWVQRFSDGNQNWNLKNVGSALRCVR